MVIKRREFLQAGSLATASLLVPKFLKAFEKEQFNFVPPGNKVVVVLQLSGGNDGLNTVIPVRNDIYYRERPRLSIDKNKANLISDEVGLHPALKAFKGFHENGELAILNNVGYPDPDRSHFRSMDIWHTGSKSNETWQTGWLGRYLDQQCKDCEMPIQALEVDDILSLAMKGEHKKGLAFRDPRRLYNTSHEKYFKELASAHHAHEHERPVDYLYQTMAETLSSADHIFQQSRLRPTTSVYPKTQLGSDMKTVASLILSDINTKVYYLSLGSFDTHINQQQQQQRLFTEMNDAVEAFVKDLKTNNRFQDVLLFTFSEFGRRVSQNASNGTDHGTANNMFLVSGGLKQKGVLNALPDLTDLNEGDLKYKVDFRSVYATILDNWLKADHRTILNAQLDKLSFI